MKGKRKGGGRRVCRAGEREGEKENREGGRGGGRRVFHYRKTGYVMQNRVFGLKMEPNNLYVLYVPITVHEYICSTYID